MVEKDPVPELYKLMDKAGLIPSNILNTRKPMPAIVTDIRTKLAATIKEYIERRDKVNKINVEVSDE